MARKSGTRARVPCVRDQWINLTRQFFVLHPLFQHRWRRGMHEEVEELFVVRDGVVVLECRHEIGRVIEAERHRLEDAVGPHEVVVQRSATEGHRNVDRRPRERRSVHEQLGQLDRRSPASVSRPKMKLACRYSTFSLSCRKWSTTRVTFSVPAWRPTPALFE